MNGTWTSIREKIRLASLRFSVLAWFVSASLGSLASLHAQECDTRLVPFDATYRYFRGRQEPTPDALNAPTLDWTLVDFDDATWEEGTGGVGYGDRTAEIGIALNDMSNSYWSVYLRSSFEVADPDSIEALEIAAAFDDGFVAYLNGVEIARVGVGVAGSPAAYNMAATSHESTNIETIAITDLSMLAEENVLAVQVHNTTLGSSDLVWVAELIGNPNSCPGSLTCSRSGEGGVNLSWVNAAPVYDSIQILRGVNDGPLEELEGDIGGDQNAYVDTDPPRGLVTYQVIATSVEGLCESCAPLECSVEIINCDPVVDVGDEWVFLRGIAPGPTEDWNILEFDDSTWESAPTGIGYGDNDDATVLADMRNNYSAIYARKLVNVPNLAATDGLVVTVAVDDGCVVYVNGEEVGRYNMPAGPVTNGTFATGAAPEPVVDNPQTFTVDKELLFDGENLVAISVHNTSLTSSDLTFIPTICTIPSEGGPNGVRFLRGDADNDGNVVLTDAVYILAHLVQGGPAPICPDAADTDDDGQLVLTDGIRLLNALFQGQVPLPAPGFLECGEDPTDDALSCSSNGAGCGDGCGDKRRRGLRVTSAARRSESPPTRSATSGRSSAARSAGSRGTGIHRAP